MKTVQSIKTQLVLVILSVTLLSTILAFSFSVIYDYKKSYADLKKSMLFTARLITENCKSPLLFRDTIGALEVLSSFEAMPMVLSATLYDANDSIFARYTYTLQSKINQPLRNKSVLSYYDKTGLHLTLPILQDNRPFGFFEMHVSTVSIKRKFMLGVGVFLLVFIGIMGLSYIIAFRLQRIISAPILELKDYSEHITKHSDYSVRIPQTRMNEIGLLQTSFDSMVRQLDKNITSLESEIEYRITSQNEAQHLRTYLKSIIDAISSLIISIDNNGLIQQVNRVAVTFLGGNAKEYINQPVTQVVPILADKEDYIKSCIEENRHHSFFRVYTHHTTAGQLHFNVSLFPLSHDAPEGLVIVIDDITEKTRIESMMIQNEKMLSLGGLAAGMAHEINNPLGIISQGVQNIHRHLSPNLQHNQEIAEKCNIKLSQLHLYLDNRKITHYLEGILTASMRAGEIVSNMLQFSRMHSQSKSRVHIEELIDQTINLAQNDYDLKKKYDFRQVTIKKEHEHHLPHLYCYPTEIQQVLLNLLKNAAHALSDVKKEEFQPTITIRTINNDPMLCIHVADNGPGIPEIIKQRIFEPFFTTKEIGVGTGLGLSVSYFIITKNHAGSLEFESEYGKGTCFKIFIPFR